MNSFELFCGVLFKLLLRSLLFSRTFYLRFASSFIALSRGDLFILSLLCYFVNPFFRFLLFLHFISLFLSLFVHFASLLCSFDTKVTTVRRSVVTLDCLLYLDKKINSQNRSSVSHWRRHPDLNWGSRCCRPMPYHLAIAPYWSGLRGSNSLPPPWQGGALPDELNPHLMVSTILYARYRNLIHKECIGDRNGARTHDL